MKLVSDTLFLAFMLSGVLFLAFPDQLYNTGGWAVWVKYAVFCAMLGYFGLYIAYGGSLAARTITIFLAWNCALAFSLLAGAAPGRVALYAIPSFAIFAPPSIRDRIPVFAPFIILVTVVGAIYEYYILGGFERFSPNGYRGVSIFVNPNNLAITAVVLCAFIAPQMTAVKAILTAAVTGGIVLYSGSKTGLVVFAFMAIYLIVPRYAARLLLNGIILGGLAFVTLAGAALLGFIDLPLESTFDRFRQATDFISIIDNPVFPFRSPDLGDVYVDNTFLQTWLEVGLPAVVISLLVLLYSAYRDGIKSALWVIFGLSAVTTNILYLWPVGYLFWLYAGGLTGSQGVSFRPSPKNDPLSNFGR